MSENNVNGIIGADVVNTTGIVGATVAIGQYIVNDYVITIAETEGDYGYTMTITRGSDTQTVTLYGLSTEQYNSMLGYLQQAQEAAQNAAGSASDAYAYLELALDAANRANNKAASAEQSSNTARGYATQAETAKRGAETAKTDAQTARTQAQGYRQAAEDAATRAGSAATEAGTAKVAAETAQSAAEAAQTAAEAAETDAQTYAGQASQSAASAAQTLTQVQAEGAAQIAAIDAEGQRVIDSIPVDYSQMEEDVTDLKSALLNPTYTITAGKYVRGDDGSFRDSTTGSPSVVSNVPVMPGDTVYIVMSGMVYGGAIGYAFYNKSDSYINGGVYTTAHGDQTITATVPSGAYKMAFTIFAAVAYKFYGNTEVNSIVENINGLRGLGTDISNVQAEVESINDIIGTVYSENLYYSAETTIGFIGSNGTINTSDSFANYQTSDFIPIKPNTDYRFAYFNPVTKVISTVRKAVLLYDSEKNVVNASYQNVTNVNSVLIENTSAVYARFSFYNSNLPMLTEGSTEKTEYIPYFTPYKIINSKLGEVPLNQIEKVTGGGVLNGKKWVLCGDSFTNYTNKDMDGGIFDGQDATYPRLIAERCSMELVQTFFRDGRTLAFPAVPGTFVNSLTCPTAECYYQNIPADADYITFYIGINDEHHYTGGGDGEDPTGVITLGTIDDNTTATYYGAWNVVLSWLITNRPNAHIGIIVTNGLSIPEWRQAQLNIAKKYGIAYIDMNGDERTSAMLRTVNPDIAATVKSALIAKWAVDPTGASGAVNTHPNWQAHEYESTFIENFLRSI